MLVQEGGGQRVLLEREEAHLRERGGGAVLVVVVVVVVAQRTAGTARDGRFGGKTWSERHARNQSYYTTGN